MKIEIVKKKNKIKDQLLYAAIYFMANDKTKFNVNM